MRSSHSLFTSFFPSGGYSPTRLTITDLYVERDGIQWWWSILATVASWLILAGYIVAPLGLHDPKETHLKTSPTTLKVIGTILLLLGYVDCIILTLVCRSWIFWQEAIFTPVLSSSILGLLSTALSVAILPELPSSNGFRAFLIALPAAFVVITGGLTWFVSHRIHTIRTYDRARRMRSSTSTSYSNAFPYGPDSDVVNLLPESEQQRKQLLRLLLNRNADKPPSPDLSSSTYRIDLPDDAKDPRLPNGSRGYLSIPSSTHELHRSRGNNSPDRSIWQMHTLRSLLPGGKDLPLERKQSLHERLGRSPSPRELRRAEIEQGGSPQPSPDIFPAVFQSPPLSGGRSRGDGFI